MSGKPKIKKPVTFACSPLKKRAFANVRKANQGNNGGQFPVVAMSFKNSGVRRIVGQYCEMESEIMSLKRRYFENRQKVRHLKDTMKEQRSKSRQIIVSCALKLQEKEKEIETLRQQRNKELAQITRELMYLHSNMLKERKLLQDDIHNKADRLAEQERELASLRDLRRTAEQAFHEVDTPVSSLDNSPDSSFSVPRFIIKPKADPSKDSDPADRLTVLPPPLPPPIQSRRRARNVPFRSQSADEAFVCTPRLAEEEHIYEKICCQKEVTEDKSGNTSGSSNVSSSSGDKDTTSLGDEGFASSQEDPFPQKKLSKKNEFFNEFLQDAGLDQKSLFSPSVPMPKLKYSKTTSSLMSRLSNNLNIVSKLPSKPIHIAKQGTDEEKMSIISPSVTSTNHRTMMKPSDVKKNKKSLKKSVTTSELSILEEHQIVGNGQLRTVTYYADPNYL